MGVASSVLRKEGGGGGASPPPATTPKVYNTIKKISTFSSTEPSPYPELTISVEGSTEEDIIVKENVKEGSLEAFEMRKTVFSPFQLPTAKNDNSDRQTEEHLQELREARIRDFDKEELTDDFETASSIGSNMSTRASALDNRWALCDKEELKSVNDVQETLRRNLPLVPSYFPAEEDNPFKIHLFKSMQEIKNFIGSVLIPIASEILAPLYTAKWRVGDEKSGSLTADSFLEFVKTKLCEQDKYVSYYSKIVQRILVRFMESTARQDSLIDYGLINSDLFCLLVDIRKASIVQQRLEKSPNGLGITVLEGEDNGPHLGDYTTGIFVLDKCVNYIKLNKGLNYQLDGSMGIPHTPDVTEGMCYFMVNTDEWSTLINMNELSHDMQFNDYDFQVKEDLSKDSIYISVNSDEMGDSITAKLGGKTQTSYYNYVNTFANDRLKHQWVLRTSKFIWSAYKDNDDRGNEPPIFMVTKDDSNHQALLDDKARSHGMDPDKVVWHLDSILYKKVYDTTIELQKGLAISLARKNRFGLFAALLAPILIEYHEISNKESKEGYMSGDRTALNIRRYTGLRFISTFKNYNMEIAIGVHWLLMFFKNLPKSRSAHPQVRTFLDIAKKYQTFLDKSSVLPKESIGKSILKSFFSLVVSKKEEEEEEIILSEAKLTKEEIREFPLEIHSMMKDVLSPLCEKLMGFAYPFDSKAFFMETPEVDDDSCRPLKDLVRSEKFTWFAVAPDKTGRKRYSKYVFLYHKPETTSKELYDELVENITPKTRSEKSELGKQKYEFYRLKYLFAYHKKWDHYIYYTFGYEEQSEDKSTPAVYTLRFSATDWKEFDYKTTEEKFKLHHRDERFGKMDEVLKTIPRYPYFEYGGLNVFSKERFDDSRIDDFHSIFYILEHIEPPQ